MWNVESGNTRKILTDKDSDLIHKDLYRTKFKKQYVFKRNKYV